MDSPRLPADTVNLSARSLKQGAATAGEFTFPAKLSGFAIRADVHPDDLKVNGAYTVGMLLEVLDGKEWVPFFGITWESNDHEPPPGKSGQPGFGSDNAADCRWLAGRRARLTYNCKAPVRIGWAVEFY